MAKKFELSVFAEGISTATATQCEEQLANLKTWLRAGTIADDDYDSALALVFKRGKDIGEEQGKDSQVQTAVKVVHKRWVDAKGKEGESDLIEATAPGCGRSDFNKNPKAWLHAVVQQTKKILLGCAAFDYVPDFDDLRQQIDEAESAIIAGDLPEIVQVDERERGRKRNAERAAKAAAKN